MENSVKVYIKVWGEGRIPQYASNHAAGCDLFATMDMAIRPGETKIMPLDFSMAIDTDLEAQVRPRSGLSLRTDLRIANSPGTVDSDYRDTVGSYCRIHTTLQTFLTRQPQIQDCWMNCGRITKKSIWALTWPATAESRCRMRRRWRSQAKSFTSTGRVTRMGPYT